jgi:hypothetical protein
MLHAHVIIDNSPPPSCLQVDEWVRTAIAERLYPILRKHFSPPVITTVAATKEAEEAKVPAAAAAAAIPASGSPDAEVEVCAYSFRDIFFVKYEAVEGGQRSVGLHRDGSSLRSVVVCTYFLVPQKQCY